MREQLYVQERQQSLSLMERLNSEKRSRQQLQEDVTRLQVRARRIYHVFNSVSGILKLFPLDIASLISSGNMLPLLTDIRNRYTIMN
jgi:hypothetical protein